METFAEKENWKTEEKLEFTDKGDKKAIEIKIP